MSKVPKKWVKAVGYKIKIPVEEIVTKIKEHLGESFDTDSFDIQSEILSGVKYSSVCIGNLDDVIATEDEMRTWYKRKIRKGTVTTHLKEFYVWPKPKLIIARTIIPPDDFFVFIANPSNVGTIQFKKNITNGRMGKPLEIKVLTTTEPHIYETF